MVRFAVFVELGGTAPVDSLATEKAAVVGGVGKEAGHWGGEGVGSSAELLPEGRGEEFVADVLFV